MESVEKAFERIPLVFLRRLLKAAANRDFDPESTEPPPFLLKCSSLHVLSCFGCYPTVVKSPKFCALALGIARTLDPPIVSQSEPSKDAKDVIEITLVALQLTSQLAIADPSNLSSKATILTQLFKCLASSDRDIVSTATKILVHLFTTSNSFPNLEGDPLGLALITSLVSDTLIPALSRDPITMMPLFISAISITSKLKGSESLETIGFPGSIIPEEPSGLLLPTTAQQQLRLIMFNLALSKLPAVHLDEVFVIISHLTATAPTFLTLPVQENVLAPASFSPEKFLSVLTHRICTEIRLLLDDANIHDLDNTSHRPNLMLPICLDLLDSIIGAIASQMDDSPSLQIQADLVLSLRLVLSEAYVAMSAFLVEYEQSVRPPNISSPGISGKANICIMHCRTQLRPILSNVFTHLSKRHSCPSTSSSPKNLRFQLLLSKH